VAKRIAVTGSNGFIGRHLCKALMAGDMEVIPLTRETVNLDFEIPSLQDADHVVHLAALSYVPQSWKDPTSFYQTNVMGTLHVLEAARKRGIPVTHISSYVYGQPEYLPIDENHPLKAENPYMQSKIFAEQACEFYKKNFDLQVCIMRPFNLYGEGQRSNFLIPLILSQVLDSKKEDVLLESLTPKRDYVHVSDLVGAIILNIKKPSNCIFNIASGQSYSVLEVTELIMQEAGIRKKIIGGQKERPNEINDTKGNIEKARLVLKWNPETDMRLGIGKILKELQSF
jgi:nucleoside-diphosphate-sugar epimerase